MKNAREGFPLWFKIVSPVALAGIVAIGVLIGVKTALALLFWLAVAAFELYLVSEPSE